MWHLIGVHLVIIQSNNHVQLFLDFHRHTSTRQPTRDVSIRATYIAYQIWLGIVRFKGRNLSTRFILESNGIQVAEVIEI